MELVEILPVHRYSVDIFYIFWSFRNIGSGRKQNTANRPVLGACELLHFPLILMNILNKTESAVFLYCRFSLFLKDPFFPYYSYNTKLIHN